MSLKNNSNRIITIFTVLFYFLFIPVLLIILFLNSDVLKQILSLYPNNPTVVSIIGSNYFHIEPMHLFSNLVLYFLLMPFVFIFDFLTNKKMLLVNMLLLFVFLPVVSSLFNILVFIELGVNIPGYGFSAINSAIFGYLAFSLFHYVRDYHNLVFEKGIFYMMWFILYINLAFISLVYNIYWLFVIIVFLFFLTILNTYRDFAKVFVKMKNTCLLHRTLFFTGFLLCLMAGVQALFPATVTRGTTIVNVFAHFVGYIFGLVVPALVSIYCIDKKKTPIKNNPILPNISNSI